MRITASSFSTKLSTYWHPPPREGSCCLVGIFARGWARNFNLYIIRISTHWGVFIEDHAPPNNIWEYPQPRPWLSWWDSGSGHSSFFFFFFFFFFSIFQAKTEISPCFQMELPQKIDTIIYHPIRIRITTTYWQDNMHFVHVGPPTLEIQWCKKEYV